MNDKKQQYVPLQTLIKMLGSSRKTVLGWAQRYEHDEQRPSGLRHSSPAPSSPWVVYSQWARWVVNVNTDYVGPSDAARLLSKTRGTIDRWGKEGFITAYEHPSGYKVYAVADLARYAELRNDTTAILENEQ